MNDQENDFDNYFDRCEVEEYIQVEDSNLSCHILPLSNTYVNEGASEYNDDDDLQSVFEDEQTTNKEESYVKEKPKFSDNGPEVQNAKLLLKYAEMQGVMPSGQVTESRDAEFHKGYRHVQEDLSADYEIGEDIIELDS